jgi:hypothetical protein
MRVIILKVGTPSVGEAESRWMTPSLFARLCLPGPVFGAESKIGANLEASSCVASRFGLFATKSGTLSNLRAGFSALSVSCQRMLLDADANDPCFDCCSLSIRTCYRCYIGSIIIFSGRAVTSDRNRLSDLTILLLAATGTQSVTVLFEFPSSLQLSLPQSTLRLLTVISGFAFDVLVAPANCLLLPLPSLNLNTYGFEHSGLPALAWVSHILWMLVHARLQMIQSSLEAPDFVAAIPIPLSCSIMQKEVLGVLDVFIVIDPPFGICTPRACDTKHVAQLKGVAFSELLSEVKRASATPINGGSESWDLNSQRSRSASVTQVS